MQRHERSDRNEKRDYPIDHLPAQMCTANKVVVGRSCDGATLRRAEVVSGVTITAINATTARIHAIQRRARGHRTATTARTAAAGITTAAR